jgi:aspartate dehydrogenase
MVKKILKIGIVGCGAIGSSLARSIVSEFSKNADLVSIYDTDMAKTYNLSSSLGTKKIVALTLEDLIGDADLVIEATSLDASFGIAQKTISASKDIIILSVGGILERLQELKTLAEEKGARMFIPSGAICGIDGVKAASCVKINRVLLTTKKPPKAFLGSPYVLKRRIRLDNISEDTVIFEGNANMAIRAFPQNINVAATLSIAGIGPEKTIVRIIASPHITKNIHEIEIDSEAGNIFVRTENIPHPDNPKTSYLAALSALQTLRQIMSSVKTGT